MASPFGAGDVIAVAAMLHKLYTALKNTSKVPVEFQATVHTLHELHRVFRDLAEDPDCVHSQAMPSSSSENWTHSMKYGLALEIKRIKSLVEEANDILVQGYIISPENGNYMRLQRFRKKLRWPRTRTEFESCLGRFDRSLSYVNYLMLHAQSKKQDEILRATAAIRLDMNRKPRLIGWPGSGGMPEDHISFGDGLGRSLYLFMDLVEKPTILHDFLKVMYQGKPGEMHVQQHHYRLFSTTSGTAREIHTDTWHQLMSPGTTCQIAFVVGTWQMACLNSCPNCNAKQGGGWETWQHCSCGTSYYVTEAGETTYEPRDGFWDGTAKDLTTRRRMTQGGGSDRSTETKHAAESLFPTSTEEQKDPATTNDPNDSHERYFRSMIMVYDPIFNFVCRNVFCRCVLGATSFASRAPRIDLLCMTQFCPQHAPVGRHANLDFVVDVEADYDYDPYFEKFGGYQSFLKCARYVNQRTIARLFTDVDKLYPTEISAEYISSLNDGQIVAWNDYRAEILHKLRRFWNTQMRSEWEEHDREAVAAVDAYFVAEQADLTEVLQRDEAASKKYGSISTVLGEKMIPALHKGRVTMESEGTVARDISMRAVW